MRILIDLRCLQTPPPRGGVAHYAEEITKHLLALDQTNEYILFANGLVSPQTHLPTFNMPNAQWHVWRFPNKTFKLAHVFHAPIKNINADVAFLPNLEYIPFIHPRTNLVVTAHDLSFKHFPDCYSPRQRAWHRILRPQKLLKRANAIVAVSETTKRDIIDTYGVQEKKVRIIYPGLKQKKTNKKQGTATTPFILTISELSPRKNLDGLIEAFNLLNLPHHLYIAGKSGRAVANIRKQIAVSPKRSRIRLLGAVSEQEKTTLLRAASCFAYLSFWEGFGFPPLEAMEHGTPVIASTNGSLPEVLGDAALYTDPLNPADIANALRIILTDSMKRKTLIERGYKCVTQYQWSASAQQLHSLIMDITS